MKQRLHFCAENKSLLIFMHFSAKFLIQEKQSFSEQETFSFFVPKTRVFVIFTLSLSLILAIRFLPGLAG